jgi:peptide/nickel transport system ATP-binding protein
VIRILLLFISLALSCNLVADELNSFSSVPLDKKRVPSPSSLVLENDSLKFYLHPHERQISDGWRTELADLFLPPVGAKISYTLETKIPANFPKRKESIVLAQWHDKKPLGKIAQRPPLSIRVIEGDLVVILWNDKVWQQTGGEGTGQILYRRPIESDKWMSFEFRIHWSALQDGWIEGYINNQLAFSYSGPIGYEEDTSGSYFKFGLYTTYPFEKPLVVYHRNYSRQRHD